MQHNTIHVGTGFKDHLFNIKKMWSLFLLKMLIKLNNHVLVYNINHPIIPYIL
jgi:hypothetical protein